MNDSSPHSATNIDVTPLDRREFIGRVAAIVAASAGMSAFDLEQLLAAELGPAQRAQVTQAAGDLKALKVMLSGDVRVFQGEYGRITPVRSVRLEDVLNASQVKQHPHPDQMGNFCGVNYWQPGDGAIDVCISQYSAGGTCRQLVPGTGGNTCTEQNIGGPGGQCNDYTFGTTCPDNTCDGQNCPSLMGCDKNNCDDQDCPNFSKCQKNKQKLFDTAFFEMYESDLYVQELFDEYNVTTSAALAQQVHAALDVRARSILREMRKY